MKQTYLPHLAARVFGVPLMVQIDKLMVILDAIGPRIGLREHVLVEGLPVVVTRPAPDDEEESMMAAGRKGYPVSQDGIAILSISGTLVKKASWMDAESGLQSCGFLQRRLGRCFAERAGRRFGESQVCLERAEDDRKAKVLRWRVQMP